jgi:DNA repair photolyase
VIVLTEKTKKETRIIYEPKKRAAEYAALAANLYTNDCGHGCTYCYVKHMPFMPKGKPQPRKDVIKLLEKDARILAQKGDRRPIQLSFTCDPYQMIDEQYQLTRQALQVLLGYGLHVQILTKGGNRSLRDFDLLSAHKDLVEYGATLVFADDKKAAQIEPYAASTSERIDVLRKAHELGIKTWVSLEPVYSPEDAYALIHQTHSFVDKFKVGKLNYEPEEKEVDWRSFAVKVETLLKSLRADYYLKCDLRRLIMTNSY